MSAEKGVDDLIRAFHLIASELPNWTLLLVGDGPERLAIESLVQELQLENQVEFSGWQRELESSYERTSLFVLPSKYEGFPNVLLECMARGIPPISFDCPSGPRAIIRNETDGLLVPASRCRKTWCNHTQTGDGFFSNSRAESTSQSSPPTLWA